MKFIANNYKSSDLFRFIRQGLGLTQKQLAEQLGISKRSIEKYEHGLNNYNFELLLKLAKKNNLKIVIESK